MIETGIDQIRGSSNDWYTVQNFTSVRNDGMQIVLGGNEMPLMPVRCHQHRQVHCRGYSPVNQYLFVAHE
ncbi:MAG: hypothetical protein R2758_09620 [Bacteroidales bacterium]